MKPMPEKHDAPKARQEEKERVEKEGQQPQVSAENKEIAGGKEDVKPALLKQIDYDKLFEISEMLKNDQNLVKEFEADAESFLKSKGFNLPEGAKVRAANDGKDVSFELRIGHIIVTE